MITRAGVGCDRGKVQLERGGRGSMWGSGQAGQGQIAGDSGTSLVMVLWEAGREGAGQRDV